MFDNNMHISTLLSMIKTLYYIGITLTLDMIIHLFPHIILLLVLCYKKYI